MQAKAAFLYLSGWFVATLTAEARSRRPFPGQSQRKYPAENEQSSLRKPGHVQEWYGHVNNNIVHLAEPKVGFSLFFLIFPLKFYQQAAFWLFILLFILLLSELDSGNRKTNQSVHFFAAILN